MIPSERPRPRTAGPELLVLAHWEAFTTWLLECCGRWPRTVRFTLAQRLEDHALDVLELLVVARYQPRRRAQCLHDANLRLERMRLLLRVARARTIMSARAFEKACHDVDAAGRMLHGWRRHADPRNHTSDDRTAPLPFTTPEPAP